MVFRQTLTVFSGKVSQARNERGLDEGCGVQGMDQLEREGLVAGERLGAFLTRSRNVYYAFRPLALPDLFSSTIRVPLRATQADSKRGNTKK